MIRKDQALPNKKQELVDEHLLRLSNRISNAEKQYNNNRKIGAIECIKPDNLNLNSRQNNLNALAMMLTGEGETCAAVCQFNRKLLVATNAPVPEYPKKVLEALSKYAINPTKNNYNALEDFAKNQAILRLDTARKVQTQSLNESQAVENNSETIKSQSEFVKFLNDADIDKLMNQYKESLDYNAEVGKILEPIIRTRQFCRAIAEGSIGLELMNLIKNKQFECLVGDEKHAEMKILDKLASSSNPSQSMTSTYIGIAKRPCAPCSVCLDASKVKLKEKNITLENPDRDSHGGIYGGWKLPNCMDVKKFIKNLEFKDQTLEYPKFEENYLITGMPSYPGDLNISQFRESKLAELDKQILNKEKKFNTMLEQIKQPDVQALVLEGKYDDAKEKAKAKGKESELINIDLLQKQAEKIKILDDHRLVIATNTSKSYDNIIELRNNRKVQKLIPPVGGEIGGNYDKPQSNPSTQQPSDSQEFKKYNGDDIRLGISVLVKSQMEIRKNLGGVDSNQVFNDLLKQPENSINLSNGSDIKSVVTFPKRYFALGDEDCTDNPENITNINDLKCTLSKVTENNVVILLEVDPVTKELKSGTKHFVGLKVDAAKKQVTYIDPMGHPMSHQVYTILQSKGFEINQPYGPASNNITINTDEDLGKDNLGLQTAQFKKFSQGQGAWKLDGEGTNITGCGPILAMQMSRLIIGDKLKLGVKMDKLSAIETSKMAEKQIREFITKDINEFSKKENKQPTEQQEQKNTETSKLFVSDVGMPGSLTMTEEPIKQTGVSFRQDIYLSPQDLVQAQAALEDGLNTREIKVEDLVTLSMRGRLSNSRSQIISEESNVATRGRLSNSQPQSSNEQGNVATRGRFRNSRSQS